MQNLGQNLGFFVILCIVFRIWNNYDKEGALCPTI